VLPFVRLPERRSLNTPHTGSQPALLDFENLPGYRSAPVPEEAL